MKIIILFILSFLLTTISCTKFGKNITVKGKVINPITGVGIPNLEVSLQRSKLFGFPSAGVKTLKTTTTNADGFFNIDALNHSQYDYDVRVNTEGLYDLGWYSNGEYKGTDTYGVNVGKVTNVDFHAVPYGKLNSHYKNINCTGVTDSMQIRVKTDFTSYTNYGNLWLTGCYEFTSTNPSLVPMGYRYYETKVIRSGITTYVYDTVFVTENGISNLEILY